jgi:hypothetical protein
MVAAAAMGLLSGIMIFSCGLTRRCNVLLDAGSGLCCMAQRHCWASQV